MSQSMHGFVKDNACKAWVILLKVFKNIIKYAKLLEFLE